VQTQKEIAGMSGSENRESVDIAVCLPVFNEEDNLEPICADLVGVLQGLDRSFEVVLVNDGSTDGSAEVLDRLAEGDGRIKVIHFRRNFGQTAAMMAAIEECSGGVIISMDSDHQNDPADIPRLLETLEAGNDVVSGWRQERKDTFLTRRLPSMMANWVISRISGVELHDYGCTLKAYRASILDTVRLYGEMHRFIPIYAAWQGARVTEIVVNHRPRRAGVSKYGLSRITRVALDLVVIKFLDTALDRPMQFFGRAGIFSLFFAFLAGLLAVYLRFFEAITFVQTPLPLLVVLLTLNGLLCILMGLLAELQIRTYFESQGKRPYLIRDRRNL
jgi:glycosyltransferase involved in cell wall biosynthesis